MSEDNSVKPVRIMLVEDHISFRQALAFILEREPEFDVVSQVGSLAEAREVEGIDVAIVDLALPDGHGVSLIQELRASGADVSVLVLSGSLDQTNSIMAVEAGADGVVDKLARLDEITGAVRRLRAGEAVVHQQGFFDMLRHRGLEADGDLLTPEEKEMVQALAEGLNSQEIADRLHIGVEEERARVVSILNKLGARSRLQAVVFAVQRGLVNMV